jgi:hypothetical protein
MWFNNVPMRVTKLRDLPEIGTDWPADDWKYADVEFVYSRTSDLVRSIIDATPLVGGFRRTLIDVKVQDLTPDIYSCVPGWHIDGAFPTLFEKPDQHHLCVLNGPQTEFVDEAIWVVPMMPLSMAGLAAQIPATVRVAPAQAGAITSFTSYDFHRGVKAEAPTRRLLVRLTETNSILARNKPQAPSQGARK